MYHEEEYMKNFSEHLAELYRAINATYDALDPVRDHVDYDDTMEEHGVDRAATLQRLQDLREGLHAAMTAYNDVSWETKIYRKRVDDVTFSYATYVD